MRWIHLSLLVLGSVVAAESDASQLPTHIKAIGGGYVLVWNGPKGKVEAHSAKSGALLKVLPFEGRVRVDAAWDARTCSFRGVAVQSEDRQSLLWEWKPGADAFSKRPFAAEAFWRIAQEKGRRMMTYADAAGAPTVAEIGKDLAVARLTAIPSPDAEDARCTFSGTNTPQSTSSPYWLDFGSMAILRHCPPRACEENHWRETELPGGWLFCASECLSCFERRGEEWIRRADLPRKQFDRLVSLQMADGIVYAVGVQTANDVDMLRIFRTTDRGVSWGPLDIGSRPAPNVMGDLFFTEEAIWIPYSAPRASEQELRLLELRRDGKHDSREIVLNMGR
jgi:hypothetical protein